MQVEQLHCKKRYALLPCSPSATSSMTACSLPASRASSLKFSARAEGVSEGSLCV